jgi:hypothetical protein
MSNRLPAEYPRVSAWEPSNQARNAVFATSRLAVFVLVMSFITGCESVLTDIATRVRYAVRDAATELQTSGDDTKIRPNG